LDATYDDHVPYVKKVPTPSAGSIKTVLEQLAVTDPKARRRGRRISTMAASLLS
jgi:hypothetical protein